MSARSGTDEGGRGWRYSATPVCKPRCRRCTGVAEYRQPGPPGKLRIQEVIELAILKNVGVRFGSWLLNNDYLT
jgi:hypothetical protein